MKDDSEFKIVKHQFVAGNQAELESLYVTLNNSLKNYREWYGCLKIIPYETINEIFHIQ